MLEMPSGHGATRIEISGRDEFYTHRDRIELCGNPPMQENSFGGYTNLRHSAVAAHAVT